jgi:hypothetical protein
MKRDPPVFPKLDVAPGALWPLRRPAWPWQQSPVHQFSPYRDIENAARAGGDLQSAFQYLKCVPVHQHRPVDTVAIQSANVAGRFMKAHQSVDGRYFRERRVDRPVSPREWKSFHSHTDQRAQPRLRTLSDRIG